MAPKADESLSPTGRMTDASMHNQWEEEDDGAEFTCSMFSPRNWGRGGGHVDERDDVLSTGPSVGSPMSAASLNPIHSPIGKAPLSPIHLDEDNSKKVTFVAKNPPPVSPPSSPMAVDDDDDDDDAEDASTLEGDKEASLLSKSKHRGPIGIRPTTSKAPSSSTIPPAARAPKSIEIPDDESEASLMVLMRYMGCTPTAYGERPRRPENKKLDVPIEKELVYDSDDDQDTLLTDDYETDSQASLQDPSQSWTKMDDTDKGEENNEASKIRDALANKPKVSSMKTRVNLTVDTTSRAKETKEAVEKAIAIAAAARQNTISPTNNAVSEAVAAVPAFKKSFDATSPMSTSSILSIESKIAAAKSETAALARKLNIASPCSSPVQSLDSKLKPLSLASPKSPSTASDKKIKSPSMGSPAPTVDTETSTKSKVEGKRKKDATISDKIKSPSVSPTPTLDTVVETNAKSGVEGDKEDKDTTTSDKKIKSPSVASPTPTLDTVVETKTKSSVEGKKKKVTTPSDKTIKSPSLGSSTSASGTVIETNAKSKVEGKKKKDATISDKKIKSPSVSPTPTLDTVVETNAKSGVEGEKEDKDTTTSDKKIKSPSVASPTPTSDTVVETKTKSSVEGKKKKVATPSDKTIKSPSLASSTLASDTVIETNAKSSVVGKMKKDVTISDKIKSPLVASPSSNSQAILETTSVATVDTTKAVVEGKKKKVAIPLDKKIKSPSVASLTSASDSVTETNAKSKVEGKSTPTKTNTNVEGNEKKANASVAADPEPSSTADLGFVKESSNELVDKGNAAAIGATDEKAPSTITAPLSVDTVANPLSPLSPCKESVREVDELLSKTREWLARHSETQAKQQDDIAPKSEKDGTPSLLESTKLGQRTVAEKKATQEVTSLGNPMSSPMSPPTLNELLHSKKGGERAMSPASPSSPLFMLSGSTTIATSPGAGRSIKEQLEEIRAKQRKLEARQKAKLGQKA